jgi:hypothetical protein
VAFQVWDLDDEGLSADVYQTAEGNEQAVDLEQPCLHWLAPVDELTPNFGDSCPGGSYLFSFPPNMFRDEGFGCCNWRTGRCGLMSAYDVLDLGCVTIDDFGDPSEQPCTPD